MAEKRVKVVNILDQEVTGTVDAFSNKVLVLKRSVNKKKVYKFFNTSFIKNIEVLKPKSKADISQKLADISAFQRKLNSAISVPVS